MQKWRFLLAEDNLTNQAVARKMLTTLGMACKVAVNRDEIKMSLIQQPWQPCWHLAVC